MTDPDRPARPDRPDLRACALPHPLPACRREQALLLMFRRMAIHGLHDAHASMVALDQFGGGFLRALHLMRAFLHGLARHASGRIQVAPGCAPRMTRHEALVVAAMSGGCPVALLELSGPDGYADLLTLAQALQGELSA
ncbi:DUF6628 family protein [Altererythrobacter sp. H2]|uniref:DUF6628 family protein n=1 Tax=Altererythrobacter sp. H2 TaxID=3108391 RepID=UPI002B4BE142|nr:DUF6628 family protein [Altererythrobacter sp. H2]WRK96888.1 DUF6628 family protein [Altererythrobacter sp. H2]